MGHRERLKGGDEWDAFTGWRRYLRMPWKQIKQRFNRRTRRAQKQFNEDMERMEKKIEREAKR